MRLATESSNHRFECERGDARLACDENALRRVRLFKQRAPRILRQCECRADMIDLARKLHFPDCGDKQRKSCPVFQKKEVTPDERTRRCVLRQHAKCARAAGLCEMRKHGGTSAKFVKL